MTDQEYDFYKTNDMGLVAYLKVCGHSSQGVEYDGTTAYWTFLFVGDLRDCLDRWHTNKARVNPREYNKHFAQTKREFYDATDG